MTGPAPRWPLLAPCLAHVVPVLWLFRGVLLAGEVPFFRDVSVYYYPNYVFLAQSAARGVWWPLWNPTSDAGAPFLVAYPVDLLSVWLLGPSWALRLGPPLHVYLAMCGATWLAWRLRTGALGAWAAGILYGLSGYVLSAVNLFELSHGIAWAPWVAAALHAVVERPTPRRAAALAALASLEVSTLAAETVLQTAVLALVLSPWRALGRALRTLALAGALTVLLVLPVVLGTRALIQGTPRAQGFEPDVSLAWSLPPTALLDAVLPRFFGDPHSFTGRGQWGQSLFTGGYPYLLSLYFGIPALLLALRAGREPTRLWGLVVVGTLLAMGSHGPLEPVLTILMRSFRTPVKFLLLTTLPLSLLAAIGLERMRRGPPRSFLRSLAPGTLLLLGALGCAWAPEGLTRVLGAALADLRSPQTLDVVARVWPGALGVTGALAAGLGLVSWRAPRSAALAAVLAALDLLVVNGTLNTSTSPAFYALRAPVGDAVREAAAVGRYRWFSYGVANTPGLAFVPEIARRESDVWLYYLDRQTLLPRTQTLDGLEAAYDEDRVGWAPEGSALSPQERRPALYATHHSRLRLANVRWVLSFQPLPDALVALRRKIPLPEVLAPLRLYEVREPLPRAFRVGRTGGESPEVLYESPDPHTIRLRTAGPAGLVIVLDGYHPDWRAKDGSTPVSVLRAFGRYRALPVSGGERLLVVRFEPSWRLPALGGLAAGLVGLAAAVRRHGAGDRKLDSPGGAR